MIAFCRRDPDEARAVRLLAYLQDRNFQTEGQARDWARAVDRLPAELRDRLWRAAADMYGHLAVEDLKRQVRT